MKRLRSLGSKVSVLIIGFGVLVAGLYVALWASGGPTETLVNVNARYAANITGGAALLAVGFVDLVVALLPEADQAVEVHRLDVLGRGSNLPLYDAGTLTIQKTYRRQNLHADRVFGAKSASTWLFCGGPLSQDLSPGLGLPSGSSSAASVSSPTAAREEHTSDH